MMGTYRNLVLLLLLILFATGCASIGPGSVNRDRIDYVSSISDSWKSQILLNIVKTRYIEPFSFVDVGQIVAGYTLETGANVLAKGALPNMGTSSSIEGGISGKFTDRPTITYTPMTGNTFTKNLMSPLLPSQLLFAIQSGVPADIIFKLGVSSINGLQNDRGSIKGYVPAEPRFVRVVELIKSLQMAGAVSVRIVKKPEAQESVNLSFPAKAGDEDTAAQIRELRDLLGVDAQAPSYRVVFGSVPGDRGEIAIQTFSVLRILAMLAARVDVPEKDLIEKRATGGIRRQAGEPGWFAVKNSADDWMPGDAYAAIKFRSNWFWIDDRDLESKRVMSFLVLLFTLADTATDKPLPLITIPAQ